MSTIALADLEHPDLHLPTGSGPRVRRHNRREVLRALQNETTASRADLARLTGLARPTVSDVVKHLLADGVVVEIGQNQSNRPGKPAVMLRLAHDASQVITVDLSNPMVARAALCTPDGQILQEATEPIGSDAVATVQAMTTELAASAVCPLIGVGIGIPVETWSRSDIVAGIELIDRLTRDLRAEISARVHLTNVADLAALAEHRYGRPGEFLLVRLGDRTSTALHLGQGDSARSTARELAHVVVDSDEMSDAAPLAATLCGCGRAGCIHSWLAPAALAARIGASSDEREVREAAARHLATALAAITGALDLHRVVISDPDGIVDDDFCAGVAAVLRGALALPHSTGVDVETSAIGSAGVLRGAAAYVVGAELGVR